MTRRIRPAALGAIALTVLALAACSSHASPTRSPSSDPPSATGGPTPTTEPTPAEPVTSEPPQHSSAPGQSALPECEGIVSTARVNELYAAEGTIEAFHGSTGLHDYAKEHGFGPVARDALLRATELRECAWGFPQSDGAVQLFVARLDGDVRNELVAALEDSVFVRSEEAGAIVFTDDSETGVAPLHKTYLFSDDLWIAELGNLMDGALGREARASLLG